MYEELQRTIERAWNDRALLADTEVRRAIDAVIEEVDKGRLRAAEPADGGRWHVNEWVKKAILLYFPVRPMRTIDRKSVV